MMPGTVVSDWTYTPAKRYLIIGLAAVGIEYYDFS